MADEVSWEDGQDKTRSADVLGVHAYPGAPDTPRGRRRRSRLWRREYPAITRDPTYASEPSSINQNWATFLQPNKTIPFRIPRIRATANMIYPGTPVSFREWSAAIAGESDFSTALGDADACGIRGRERMHLGHPGWLLCQRIATISRSSYLRTTMASITVSAPFQFRTGTTAIPVCSAAMPH